jgi:hypothetical protein
MKNASRTGGSARGSRRLAFAADRERLKVVVAELDIRVSRLEVELAQTPISKRRGRWLEKQVPRWIEDTGTEMARLRLRYLLVWMSIGAVDKLRELERRQVAAYRRVLLRVAEERAKGWPLKTLYGAGKTLPP